MGCTATTGVETVGSIAKGVSITVMNDVIFSQLRPSEWRPWQTIRTIAGRLADVALPPRCVACGRSAGDHDALCGGCWAGIDFIQQPLCDRLGIPLPFAAPDSDAALVSAAALADPPAYDRARSVARYSDVMRRLIHDLKYRDRHIAVVLFTRWLQFAGSELLKETDLLVPVPLHASRLWFRRFNQSALLASALSRTSGRPCDPLLLARTRRTRSQVGLSADQRTRNLSGAISVTKDKELAVKGRAILLIDDVITTGATANACAKALRRAGAARIDVLALGRVVDPLAARQ